MSLESSLFLTTYPDADDKHTRSRRNPHGHKITALVNRGPHTFYIFFTILKEFNSIDLKTLKDGHSSIQNFHFKKCILTKI